MMKNLILVLTCFLFACSRYSTDVENALEQAGNNRGELEKVLKHYSENKKDSIKLRAAEFFIANMPGHWSYDKKMQQAYYKQANLILSASISKEEKVRKLNVLAEEYPELPNSSVEDIQIIRADYLIQNIEDAFETWENSPWARHLSFDEFCEYLLPYKVADGQPLDNWREVMKQQFSDVLKDLDQNEYYKNSTTMVAAMIIRHMQLQMTPNISQNYHGIPLLAAGNITKIPTGTCEDYSTVVLAVMRSLGIPVATDFLPQHPHQADSHSWNVLADALRKNITFEDLNGVPPGNIIRPYSKLGKVYRKTYAINPNLQKLQQEEQVPSVFQNVFLKDVTAEYCPVANALVEVIPQKRQVNKSPYLAVFNNQDWVPVALGEKKKNKMLFSDLGKDIVYLPVYAAKNDVESFNYPFLLEHSGNIKYFVPDTTKLKTITVNRKYPVFTKTFEATKRTIGAKIQVSNDNDFQNAMTIHSVDQWESSGSIAVSDTLSAYRYWRFCLPYPKYSFVAELMFFRSKDKMPYLGRIIGSDFLLTNDSTFSREKAFDNDPFTFFQGDAPDLAWVGMDFGEPTKISKIIYLPRSDDNNIRIGDVYELFYWAKDGWQSLGTQQAGDIRLTFKSVPDNALLWLRDLTRGKEERIFTYENGKQVWW
jgi:hypothetical protein